MGNLQLEKIYLRQCVLNHTPVAEAVNNNEEPKVDYKLQVNHVPLADAKHEVILTMVAEYKQADKVTATLQIQQAGIFVVKDFTPEQREAILQGYCVNQLFPHFNARVAELSQQAGLKPLMLPLMDFTLIYQQSKQQKEANKVEQSKTSAEETAVTESVKTASIH